MTKYFRQLSHLSINSNSEIWLQCNSRQLIAKQRHNCAAEDSLNIFCLFAKKAVCTGVPTSPWLRLTEALCRPTSCQHPWAVSCICAEIFSHFSKVQSDSPPCKAIRANVIIWRVRFMAAGVRWGRVKSEHSAICAAPLIFRSGCIAHIWTLKCSSVRRSCLTKMSVRVWSKLSFILNLKILSI